jgi:hypothetical protein
VSPRATRLAGQFHADVDRDLADSSMPRRPLRPLVPLDLVAAREDEAAERAALGVLHAVDRALGQAVDLSKPHRSAGRALTVASLIHAATVTGDVDQLVESLDQLLRAWQGGGVA